MRYGPEHKQATHERILVAAESLFRRQGFAGASVERVMRQAGLTVGGFYAHFASKDALLGESVRAFMRRQHARWTGGLEDLKGAEWLSHFVHRYLNRHIRDDLETGCIMPSLLSDLTRADADAQAAFAEGLEALAAELGPRVGEAGDVTARQRALATATLLFGAMTLARATKSQPLSDEILQAARAYLVGSAKRPEGLRRAAPRKDAG